MTPQAQHIYNSNIYKAMENHTENINQGRPVYFSYASNSSEMQTTQPQTRTAQFKNVFLIGIVFLIYSLTSCSSTTNNKVDNVADSDIANNVKVADTSIEGESEILSKAYDLYDEGNYSDAIGCLENLANKGSVRAQFCIGNCYDKMSDYKKANEWYQKAAELGYAAAQFNLGVSYESGQGVTQNYQKALEWYQKAADQGKADAQYNVGIFYANGYGVAENYTKAVEWFKKAAEQGVAEAQYNLGVAYEEGISVQKDISKAKEWYQRSADQGCEEATEALNKLKQKEANHTRRLDW